MPATIWTRALTCDPAAGRPLRGRGPSSLPGRTPARAGVLTLLILAVAAVLWFYVFPRAALHLPIDASGFSG